MSLSDENIVTKRPTSEAAQVTAKPSPGWLESINPFSSKSAPKQDDTDVSNDLPQAVDFQAPIAQTDDQDKQTGWFDFSFKKIIVIIIILLFLGFNVLKMSGEGLESLGSVMKSFFGSFGFSVGDTIKKTADNSAAGSKEVIDVAKDAVNDAVDDTEEILTGKKTKQQEIDKKNNENLAEAVDQPPKVQKKPEVVPDDAGSSLQQSKGAGKAGWCFVGEDRGFRSCVEVGINDDCVSGDVFPTREICVNPTLRE